MTDVPYDDEPLGPEDGEVNRLTGETFDAARGEYTGGDEPPPMFTEEQFTAVVAFFRQSVAQGVTHPIALLIEPENREIDRFLSSIAYHSAPRCSQVQNIVRGLMRQHHRDEGDLSPYNGETVRDFTLKPYTDAAGELRRRVNQRERRLRGVRRNVQAGNLAAANDMLASDSPFLVAVGTLLATRRGRVWWDDFQKNYMTDWDGTANDRVTAVKPLTEDIILNIKVWIIPHNRILSKLGTLTLTEAVQQFAKMDVRNELTDYLKSLTWDGTKRLEDMAKNVFGIEGNEFATRAVINMMVSAVARAFNPGCQMSSMLVIQSAQDMGKSKLIRILAGDRWYREVTAKPGDKDFVTNMQGGWLLEIAEMASLAKYGTDDPVVKDAISRASDFIRPPYGRVVQEYRRASIFIATTNQWNWHRDVTGGKRFWPVTAIKVDLDYALANREQLWAEAVRLYADGWAYWEVPLEGHAEALNEAAQSDPLEDRVLDHLVSGLASGSLYGRLEGGPQPVRGTDPEGTTAAERFGNLITIERVGCWWMGIDVENINRRQHDVARVLKRLNLEPKLVKVEGRPARIWVCASGFVEALGERGLVTGTPDNSGQWNLIPE